MNKIAHGLPWWAKMTVKIVLARFPIQYQTWRNMGGFVHGKMDTPSYAYSVFKLHHCLASPPAGFNMLELGPGDSAASAMIARAYGAATVWLVDAGDFAARDMKVYRQVASALNAAGYPLDVDLSNFEQMLASCNARYLTNGLEGLKSIPDKSVDFLWSQAVLEHVRKADLPATFQQIRRIMRVNGSSTHKVDFKDHLGGGLNNLRFSERIWESSLMSRSGFYTNRVRLFELKTMMESAGFIVEVLDVDRWKKLPILRKHLAPEFSDLTDEDLLICSAILKLRPG